MSLFRIPAISTLSVVIIVLLTPARQAVAQQRPGIRAQINAPEGCSISDPVDTEDTFNFIKTQIQALSFARKGERAGLETSPAAGSNPNSVVPNFVGLREARIDNTCAGFILSPYTTSKIKGVATAAKSLVSAYQELANMSDELLGITLRETVSANSVSALGQASDWSRRRQVILKKMNDTVNQSLSQLTRTNEEGKASETTLSPGDRHSLLVYLNSKFPVGNPEAIGNSVDFVKQAALIRSYLSGGYKQTTN